MSSYYTLDILKNILVIDLLPYIMEIEIKKSTDNNRIKSALNVLV